jgi:glycosyltransferase involved in cell wall biosynthesis
MAHIVHIAKYYPPSQGGIERVVQTYAEAFAALGHRVTVIAFADRDGRDDEQPVPGVHVVRFASDINVARGQFSRRYFAAVQRLAQSADIIHMHEPNPLGTVALLMQRGSTPIHITWHADITRHWYAMPVVKPLQAALCRRATSIQVSSASLQRSSYMLHRFPEKTAVVPLGLDLTPFLDGDTAARGDAWRAKLGGRYVLAVGRLASYKGYDVLLQALAGTDIRMVIAGQGSLHNELIALRGKLGLDATVTFLGSVEESDLGGLYAGCAFFAFPSSGNGEAFGLVQVEAMASGKPVINTRLDTGVPEVSLDGVTGITVPPRDAVALRAALLELWTDQARVDHLGAAARERAIAHFDQHQVARRVATLYGLA